MSHVVVIEGLSGLQRYLARGREVNEKKHARRFRSADSAAAAARDYVAAYPSVVRRQLRFEVRSAE